MKIEELLEKYEEYEEGKRNEEMTIDDDGKQTELEGDMAFATLSLFQIGDLWTGIEERIEKESELDKLVHLLRETSLQLANRMMKSSGANAMNELQDVKKQFASAQNRLELEQKFKADMEALDAKYPTPDNSADEASKRKWETRIALGKYKLLRQHMQDRLAEHDDLKQVFTAFNLTAEKIVALQARQIQEQNNRAQQAQLVQLALDHPDSMPKEAKASLFMKVVNDDDLDLVSRLLKQGYDPNIRFEGGIVALMFVESAEMAKLLLDAGAEVNVTDDNGLTPLFLARKLEIAERLLQAGADPNAKDKNGQTPIFHVAIKRDFKRITLLANSGADLNIANPHGVTILMGAADKGMLDVVEALLDAGADPKIKTAEGVTALDIAVNAGHKDIADVIRKRV